MTHKVGLDAFLIAAKVKYAKEWAVLGTDIPLYEHLCICMDSSLNRLIRIKDKKLANSGQAFKVVKIEKHAASKTITGIIESGRYGAANAIRNTTADKIAYQKKIRDADMPPYYFRFHVPDRTRRGVALLQSVGNLGIKSVLMKLVTAHMNSENITMKLNPLSQTHAVKEFQDSALRDVRIITYTQKGESRRFLKQLRLNGKTLPEGSEVRIQVIPSARVPRVINKMSQIFDGQRPANSLIEITGLPIDEMSTAKVRLGNDAGRQRSFRLKADCSVGMTYDITDEVTRRDGHATYASVHRMADEIEREVIAIMPIK